ARQAGARRRGGARGVDGLKESARARRLLQLQERLRVEVAAKAQPGEARGRALAALREARDEIAPAVDAGEEDLALLRCQAHGLLGEAGLRSVDQQVHVVRGPEIDPASPRFG